MASNGYVRCCCSKCIFYENDKEFGNMCLLQSQGLWDWEELKWVSSFDCKIDPKLKEAYYEPCIHYVGLSDVRQKYREKFGIFKTDLESDERTDIQQT